MCGLSSQMEKINRNRLKAKEVIKRTGKLNIYNDF